MSYSIIKKLPSMESIIQEIPLSVEFHEKIAQDRKEVNAILSGKDQRLLMIIGPCSAWPNSAVLEYAKRLQILNRKYADRIKIIMRVYIQKPRTTKGWTGPVNQPNPLLPPDIETGIRYVRRMMIDVIKLGLPIADEALFTHNAKGFMELLSWVAIGARSAEDQEHRVFASSIDCAVGLKNPTHGSINIGINSVIAAQYPHVAVFDGYEVQTHGNDFAHLVLRGSNHAPNYSIEHLQEADKLIRAHAIKNPAIIIDASHDNCLFNGKKDYARQSHVIFDVLDSIKTDISLKQLVKGFMVESFIKSGNQTINPEHMDLDGLSITDPCLNWEDTELLLKDLYARLEK